MKGALVDEAGAPTTEPSSRPTNASAGADSVVATVLDFVDRFLPSDNGTQDVVAVGVGVPGIVDEREGIAVQAVNLGWRDVPLKRRIEDATGLPVVVGHDVRSAALGEQEFGAAQGLRDFLFVSIGTGVGAGVVLRGEAYAGSSFAGGEFGHMTIDTNGPVCACGRKGCIEAVASARAIERRYAARAGTDERVLATDIPGKIDAGDEIARAVWDEAVAALAVGILDYVTLLDPEAVVIGGGLASAGDRLLSPLTDAIDAGLLPFQRRRPVVLGALGGTAGWRGAAARALRHLGGSTPGSAA
jgi:glucokinase